MHKYPLVLLLLITVVSAYLVLFSDREAIDNNINKHETESVYETENFTPYKASFLIIINGISNDFSAARFHNLSPNVFIDSDNPAVVNVMSPDVTWNDFFSSLPIGLSEKCLTTSSGQSYCDGTNGFLRFYLNEQEQDKIFETTIQPDDQLLITFGNETENELKLQFMRFATVLQQEKNVSSQPKEE